MNKFLLLALAMASLMGSCSDGSDPVTPGPTPEPTPEPLPVEPTETDKEIKLIADRVRQEFRTTPSDKDIDAMLSNFKELEGSFTNLDYTDKSKTNWIPAKHLENLNKMADAYINKGNKKYYENKAFQENIVKALQYWLSVRPKSTNWWYNDIHQCKYLGLVLVKMKVGKEPIPATVEKNILSLLTKECGRPDKNDGANSTDTAINWIIRSCVNQNRQDLTTAINAAFNVLSYDFNQGFQLDGSFFQHGSQLYVGGYGYEAVRGLLQIATLVKETTYALNPQKQQILDKFMLECFFQTMRGKYMSAGVLGRSVSRIGNVSKGGAVKFAKSLAEISPSHAAEYNTIADRIEGKDPSLGVKSYHNHFFLADYTLHVRPKYTFDVRLVSKFTGRCECGNKENLKGYFISDGMTNIMVDGDEYYDVMPAWTWSRLPGVTAPDYDNDGMPPFEGWSIPGTSTFAGGVNNGVYGVSAYSYFDKYKSINTGANKSWFFFDDEVVCLGSVKSDNSLPLNTTVNQCTAKGGVSVFDNTLHSNVSGQNTYANPKWVFHNKVGYVFPEGGNVWVTSQNQSGSWNTINNTQKDGEVSVNMFSLGFNHDAKKTYAYIVVPGITSSSVLDVYTKSESPVQIVRNTDKVQAVYHKTLKNLQIAFFEGNQDVTVNDIKVKSDKRCVVMLEQKGNSYKVFVADPARTSDTFNIEVTIGGKTHKIAANFNDSASYAGQTKEFAI